MTPTRRTTVALVGNPNSGKTTIFNALTGLRQKVGNYPGITVEKRTGEFALTNGVADVIDLPGTYSLVSASPDEQVVSDVLRGIGDRAIRPDVVIGVVDASNLARNLYLVSQLLDLHVPMVIALNMVDMATEQGRRVDASLLANILGCPVVPVVGRRQEGITELIAAIPQAICPKQISFPVDSRMHAEEQQLAELLVQSPQWQLSSAMAAVEARRLLTNETAMLDGLSNLDAVLSPLIRSAQQRMVEAHIDPAQQDIESRYRWIDTVIEQVVKNEGGESSTSLRIRRSITERVDSVLMHRVWGLLLFAVIMTVLFASVFWLAKPLMDGVKLGVAWLANKVGSSMAPGALKALVVDGIFAGVGTVLVFVPQIAMLFVSLALLEDSGYLARAAFLMDRLLSKVGLHGKSFIPLLSSFACAIPGILSARTIEGRRDRLATILVAPFMSCSARLPVYTLLVGVSAPGMSAFQQGLLMVGLYVLGIVAAVCTSLAIKGRLEQSRSSAFILELPTYKRPQFRQIFWQVWTHTRSFVTRAGTTICALSIVLWALLYYPRLPQAETTKYTTPTSLQAAQIEHSVAGRIGHTLEPIVRPLGFDWKIAVGLVGAFAAREIFVSTLGIAYSVGEVGEDTGNLSKAMSADRDHNGRTVWTPLVAVSLMLWFVLAMQCMSTMAVVRRETGGWKWPIAQLLFMNSLAYVVCLIVFQVGRRFFGA